jgi:hypothetical protein
MLLNYSRGGGSCITVSCCPSLPLIFPIWQYTFDHVAADRASMCNASVSLPSTLLLLGWWSRNLCVTSRRGSTNCAAVCADWKKTNFGSKTQRDGFLDRPAARGFFKRRPSRALLHNPAPIAQRFELRSIPSRYRLTISLVHAASMPPLAGALGESPPRDHKRTSAPCSHSTSAIGWMHTLQTPIKCAETTSVCSSSSPVQAVVVRSVR